MLALPVFVAGTGFVCIGYGYFLAGAVLVMAGAMGLFYWGESKEVA